MKNFQLPTEAAVPEGPSSVLAEEPRTEVRWWRRQRAPCPPVRGRSSHSRVSGVSWCRSDDETSKFRAQISECSGRPDL